MNSWFNPKTEKRNSSIQGRGLFAREEIGAGEIVAVKGGAIFSSSALALISDQISPADIQIEDDLYIAPRNAAEVEENILCLNHSCDPNVGVRGQITFVTMRDVPAGCELTIDYAMIDGDPRERMGCSCGAPQCRGTITGNDWRLQSFSGDIRGFSRGFLKIGSQRKKAHNTRLHLTPRRSLTRPAAVRSLRSAQVKRTPLAGRT
jgi:hypothetical protein